MNELRRKVLLPVFQLSELTTGDDPRALKRVIKQGKGHPALTYHYRFVWDDEAERGFNHNLFPVVLDRNAVPWYLGTLYILAQLEAETNPVMTTYQSRADDLGAYKEWLDTHDRPDDLMFQFPKIKLRRPTYRYRGHLQQRIQAGEVAPATAKRRMGTVVAFYRWLIDNNYLQPEYPPWEEGHYQLAFKTTAGLAMFKKVVSTDVSIRTPKSDDPFAGTIQDGGKLLPLTGKEQNWILETTKAKGNTECYLIQLFMLATGARIQTAGTLRLRHFTHPNPRYAKALTGDGDVFKLKAGPGTGIDTKNDKNGVLQIPRPIYELLRTYALSERSTVRRGRFVAKHGEHPDHYLFLTQQGNPYYTAKADAMCFNPDLDRRHEKTGQPVRQFLKEHVIPYVREHHDKHFHYRIHDLRASFGMNMTELLMELVQKGTITLSRARMTVKELLWHESFATTDLYLDYRSQMDAIYEAVNGYGKQLQEWVEQAMKGVEVADE
ncbi:MAG: tyrosine-type recombinase/integrase [Sulfuritalea sp.]|nr:tyrosine-type recombinase/integrase [Sulfuritalea sp.]